MIDLSIEITNLDVKDKVIVNGTKRVLQKRGSKFFFQDPDKYFISVEDNIDLIEGVEKYFPRIYFDGSNAFVNSYVRDLSGKCVFMDMIGQEQHVRSISSMIMQGNTRTKDSAIYCDCIDMFTIFSAGNRRVIQSLGNGIAHSILFNKDSIVSQEHKMLIGHTEEIVYKRFLKWLKVSMKYPTYNKYNEVLFQRLKDNDLILKTESHNIISYEISQNLLDDDCQLFKDNVIEILKENNEIDIDISTSNSDSKTIDYNYPISKYLTKEQVIEIYKKLETLPNLYETDGQKIKPVGIKIFGASMTYYVVESHKGDKNDTPFESCFGYVKNESDPSCSEWGYFSIPELLEVAIPIKMIGLGKNNITVGYEMDLYFKDKYIKYNGDIIDKNEIDK